MSQVWAKNILLPWTVWTLLTRLRPCSYHSRSHVSLSIVYLPLLGHIDHLLIYHSPPNVLIHQIENVRPSEKSLKSVEDSQNSKCSIEDQKTRAETNVPIPRVFRVFE